METDISRARPSDRAGHEPSQSTLSRPSGDHPSRGWYQEQRERSDRIGYVLTRTSLKTGRTFRASRKVFHDLNAASRAAMKLDPTGDRLIYVDLANTVLS